MFFLDFNNKKSPLSHLGLFEDFIQIFKLSLYVNMLEGDKIKKKKI
jgi:hypothetical protein